jgi:hypothetical protein
MASPIIPIRLQIYDDGAGEYLFSASFNSNIVAGNEDANSGLPNGAIGPFILPSPCAVTKPGLLTITMSNVNAPLNSVEANGVVAFVALVFAIPKKCRGEVPSYYKGIQRRGVLS